MSTKSTAGFPRSQVRTTFRLQLPSKTLITRLYKGAQVTGVVQDIRDKLDDICSKGVTPGYVQNFFDVEYAKPNTFVIVAYRRTTKDPVGVIACSLEIGVQRYGALNRVLHVLLLCSAGQGVGKLLMDLVEEYGRTKLKADVIVLEAVQHAFDVYKKWGFHRGLTPNPQRNELARLRYKAMERVVRGAYGPNDRQKLLDDLKLAMPSTKPSPMKLKNLRITGREDYLSAERNGRLYENNAPYQHVMWKPIIRDLGNSEVVDWNAGGRYRSLGVTTFAAHTTNGKRWVRNNAKMGNAWNGSNLTPKPLKRKRNNNSASSKSDPLVQLGYTRPGRLLGGSKVLPTRVRRSPSPTRSSASRSSSPNLITPNKYRERRRKM